MWQAVQPGIALSSLYRTIHSAVHAPTQQPVRYIGAYTDGGSDKSLWQNSVDYMCALVFYRHQGSGF